MARVQTGLNRVDEAIAPTDTPVERILLSQYQKRYQITRRTLPLSMKTLSPNVADNDELFVTHSTLKRQQSSTSYKIKSLLVVPPADTPTPATTDGTEVKLPKVDVPTFDGNIIHWKQFWDQFTVAVHSKTSLSNAEKTVYLQHAIKDGSARSAIEGMSHSGDNYEEAVEWLKSRYNRPRLIQRTHVQLVVNTPPLKEGSGKELQRLHDNVHQHVLCP